MGKLTIIQKHWGEIEGRDLLLFTLSNTNNIQLTCTNYGARWVSLHVPDRTGKLEDVILGYDTLDSYTQDTAYQGAIIGRYANRIANGNFSIDNFLYQLPLNNGNNHLHGGLKGFDKQVWQTAILQTKDVVCLKLSYQSKHMEEGYPGNLNVSVSYMLDNDNQITVAYEATTDQATIINLTHHPYFNLSGTAKNDVLDHVLQLNASNYLPVDSNLISIGTGENVEGTPFDFQQPATIGSRIHEQHPQLQIAQGYDHCWVLKDKTDQQLIVAGSLYEPVSGRYVQVLTTKPGIQVYTGNFLDAVILGKNGISYKPYSGVCLETQHFPDSPNHFQFTSTLLKKEERYNSQTIYKIGVK